MKEEKRRFSRIFFDAKSSLTVAGKVYEVDRIVNLSVGGCLLELEAELVVGANCSFTMCLPQMAAGVDVLGEIVRVESGRVGVRFTTIEYENLFHLKNIVRYNANDPDSIEKEISARPGLK